MAEYEPNDSRRVTSSPVDKQPGKRPAVGWREAEQKAGEPKEAYEPVDSRNVTLDPADREPGGRAEPGWREKERGEGSGKARVRQHNNAQEATGGSLPDPRRAEAFDQDEG